MPEFRPRSNIEIVDASVELYRRHFATFFAVALMAVVPSLLQFTLFGKNGLEASSLNASSTTFAVVGAILAIIGSVLSTVTFGGLIILTSNAYLGQSLDVGSALSAAGKRFWALCGAGMIVGLAVGIGFLLLIVPGLLMLARYFSTGAILLLENKRPMESTERSANLSKGFTGKIVLLLISLYVLTMIMFGGLAMAIGLVASPVFSAVIFTVAATLITPMFAIISTVVYYDLRIRNEGYDIDLLAQRAGAAPSAIAASA